MISESVQLALIGSVTTVCTGLLAIMLARVKGAVDRGNEKSEATARERNQRLKNIEQATEETKHTAKETKKIANGEKLNLLESNASLAKRLADKTGHQDDVAYAAFAARTYAEHKKIHAKNDHHE